MKRDVAIVGAGYVGLPLARVFADAGKRVLLVDVNPARVDMLSRGESYVEDVPAETLRPFVDDGLIAATTDYDELTDADAILVCEVLTPAGNWSSWPPHKHDEDRPGQESALEEIYYFETRSTDPRGTDPVGYQRVYGTDERPIDVLAEVRTGDVVLVPHGWHGPAMAAPDADLYYLNVMAGPGTERAWLISDDPAHAWVREGWTDDAVDPRLPLSSSDGGQLLPGGLVNTD